MQTFWVVFEPVIQGLQFDLDLSLDPGGGTHNLHPTPSSCKNRITSSCSRTNRRPESVPVLSRDINFPIAILTVGV